MFTGDSFENHWVLWLTQKCKTKKKTQILAIHKIFMKKLLVQQIQHQLGHNIDRRFNTWSEKSRWETSGVNKLQNGRKNKIWKKKF